MLRTVLSRGAAASALVALHALPLSSADTEKPKLTYFDLRGLAEQSRILMKIGGMDFVDDRIPFSRPISHEFTDKKASGAFDINMGRVPVLEGEDAPPYLHTLTSM